MYKLVIKSKELLDDNQHIQAVCDFTLDSKILKQGIVIKATAESFEQTALEVGEVWARNFELLANIKQEIPVDLEKIEQEREEQRERERIEAEAAKTESFTSPEENTIE